MSQKEQINQDIRLFKMNSSRKRKPFYYKSDSGTLLLAVNLQGRSKHKSLVCEYQGERQSNHTYIEVHNHFEGISNIDSDGYTQAISLSIQKDYLHTLLPKSKLSENIFEFFQSNKSGKRLSAKKTNFKTQILAKEILKSPYDNTLDKLYLEAKALELIHTEFNILFYEKEKNLKAQKFSNQDQEALHHAKDILMNNISNPPSIKELAKMVAINELKLKTGFRTFFNQTPYSISLEYRLQEAKKLLESSEMSIGEIAKHIGYKYSASFTKAFLKRFGIPPKELMKSRMYYY